MLLPNGGASSSRGPYELLAERHVRHLANEHKLCKTPANQCTLTLLPFDLKLYKRTSLERTPAMICCNGGFEQRDPGGRAARWRFENRVRAAALSIET